MRQIFTVICLLTVALTIVDSSAAAEPQTASALEGHVLARAAQRAWRNGDFASAAELYSKAIDAYSATATEPRTVPATVGFNAALAHLKIGDYARAAELFSSLAPSDSEAAEGLGVALFDTATTNSVEKLQLLEEAAAAFQTALRSLPSADARAANLAAAIDALPALREEIRAAEIAEKFGSKPLEELFEEAIKSLRENFTAAANAFADDSPAQIERLEEIADKQAKDAAVWVPLVSNLLEQARSAFTNENDFATFKAEIENAKARAEGAAVALENINPDALDAMRRSEETAFSLFATTAPPPQMLAQAIISQSNALAQTVSAENIRTPAQEQGVAIGVFDGFSKKFAEWAEQQEIEEAARKEIDDLTTHALGTHSLITMEMSSADTLLNDRTRINAESSLADMLRIMELLPKPQSQQQQQQEQQQQEKQQQEQQQQEQSDQSKPEQNEQNENGDSGDSNPDQDAPADPVESINPVEDKEQKEAEEIMARILEQEKQRESERRARLRNLPAIPGEKDW